LVWWLAFLGSTVAGFGNGWSTGALSMPELQVQPYSRR
jgi:hypothetical protein